MTNGRNETPSPWDYNLLLRAGLDAAGFAQVKIAASDQGNGWAIPTNLTQLAVIDAVAAHYPGVHGGPPPAAEKALLNSLSKPMFAAEDGAGTNYISSTWTRTINQNYVRLSSLLLDVDRSMDGWMDGWMDGLIDRSID